MKPQSSLNALAILAANAGHEVGFTSLSIGALNSQSWQQLLPAGYFSAVDGRPHDVPSRKWFLDAIHAQLLINKAQLTVNDLVIDYEHQTLNSEQNGQPAPAAGWFKSEIEWREGSGLWIRPRWTQKAIDFIRQGEYRFLSAVFTYDKKTGIPQSLHSAALVNRAGLDGMQSVEALKGGNLSPQTSSYTALSQKEREIAWAHCMAEDQYCQKKALYCSRKGTTWEALTRLTQQERDVMTKCGVDSVSFLETKINTLAREIILTV